MPAELVPDEAIPQLAARIDSPAMLRVLEYLQKAGFVMTRSFLDEGTLNVLQRLAALGLADPGYAEPSLGSLFIWVRNHNGERILDYFKASPAEAERLRSKVIVKPLARTTLGLLRETNPLTVMAAVEALEGRDPASWPREKAVRLNPDENVYLLSVTPDLRAFVRVLDSGELELFDIVRKEALELFPERQGAGAPQ
jgi:hypothetical protein